MFEVPIPKFAAPHIRDPFQDKWVAESSDDGWQSPPKYERASIRDGYHF